MDYEDKLSLGNYERTNDVYFGDPQLNVPTVDDEDITWIDHFGMHKFQCHCSGHARSRDLLQIVDDINARTLYPVHTEHPEIYKRTAKNVTEVIEGRSYPI